MSYRRLRIRASSDIVRGIYDATARGRSVMWAASYFSGSSVMLYGV
jgi:hypothetical protein